MSDSDADLLDSSDESDTLESHNTYVESHNNSNVVTNSDVSENKSDINSSNSDFKNFTINIKMNKNIKADCVICSEKINKNDLVSILMCNHYFHSNCILKWYELKKNLFVDVM